MVLVAACTSHADPTVANPPAERAFYFWRTTFALAPAERAAIDKLHVTRLYLRVFDIAWQDAPAEVGKLAIADAAPAGVDIVPVVFVRDEVFRKLPRERLRELAATTWRDVAARLAGFATPHELQLDCDWTDSTRDAYFAFLRELRAVAKLRLSATIRLHQVKYRERTGVPPVERGMLMFYNMGTFSADAADRAIFDAASAARYVGRIGDYPLPLDAALPIWSWTLHVRDERVIGLLQSTDPGELAGLDFVTHDGAYVATRTAFLHGELLREGDVLKPEVMGPVETLTAASMLQPHLAPTGAARTLALFDLSERNLTRHGIDHLEQTYRAVR